MIMERTKAKPEIKIGRYYRFKLDLKNCVLQEPEPQVLNKHGKRCKVIGKGEEDWSWLVTFGKSWGSNIFVNDNELIPLRR